MAVVAPAVPNDVAVQKADAKPSQPNETSPAHIGGNAEHCKVPQVKVKSVLKDLGPSTTLGLEESVKTAVERSVVPSTLQPPDSSEREDDWAVADQGVTSETGAGATVELSSEDADHGYVDEPPTDAGAPAAGAPAGTPADVPNVPAPAAGGVPPAAGGVDGAVPALGNGGGPVVANGGGGGDQGGGGGDGAAVWDDGEDDEDMENFMARAYELFLSANPMVPEACSAQEAAEIAAATMSGAAGHAAVGDIHAALSAAATAPKVSATPAAAVIPEAAAPVEQTINLVPNEPNPSAAGGQKVATVKKSAAAPLSPTTNAGASTSSVYVRSPAAAVVATAGTGSSAAGPSSIALAGGKKSQAATAAATVPAKEPATAVDDDKRKTKNFREIADEEAKRKAAEQLANELIMAEEAEKAKKEKANKKKSERKKAAKAAKKAGVAGAAGEEGEEEAAAADGSTRRGLSGSGPSGFGVAEKAQPAAAVELQPAEQEPAAASAAPVEGEVPPPKPMQAAKAAPLARVPAVPAVPTPAPVAEPPAPTGKKEKMKKTKETVHTAAASTSDAAGTSSSTGLSASTARMVVAATAAAPVSTQFRPAAAATSGLGVAPAAAAPAPHLSPMWPPPYLSAAPAAAAAATPSPPTATAPPPGPFINPALALVNPALAAAAGRLGGSAPMAVPVARPTVGVAPLRAFPGVRVHPGLRPFATVNPALPVPVVFAAGGAPTPVVVRPAVPQIFPASRSVIAQQQPQPLSAVQPVVVRQPAPGAVPFVPPAGVAPPTVVRAHLHGGGQYTAAPMASAGTRPTNAMAAAFMQYRSTTVTAAAAAVPNPVAPAVPAQTTTIASKYDDDEHLCVVCMENTRSILLMPCGHLVLCGTCLPAIEAKGNLCPICRESIQDAQLMAQ